MIIIRTALCGQVAIKRKQWPNKFSRRCIQRFIFFFLGLCTHFDQDDRTALHWAASSGATDIAQYLLNNGAEVDKPDSSGWTALHVAGKIFDLMLQSRYSDIKTAILLHHLVSAGNEEIVKELVGAGADVNKKNDKGMTPL